MNTTQQPTHKDTETQATAPQPTGEVCVHCGSDRAVLPMNTRPGYKMCFLCGDKKPPREAQR